MTLHQSTNVTAALKHQGTMIDFRDSTTQGFDNLRYMIEVIIPTLRTVFESGANEQTRVYQQESMDLRHIMNATRETTLRTYSMLLNMQRNIPNQIERQQPIHFIDACGFHAPFHLEFVNSWEAFEAVLEVRFRTRGPQKIRRREYILEKASTRTLLNRDRPWGSDLLPGSTVHMDMVFDMPSEKKNTCPVCKIESCESMEAEVDWYVELNYAYASTDILL
jgi:hypothetical protein